MDEFFVSCSLDKLLRIWNIESGNCVNYINIQDYITCLSVFPYGDQIIIGTQKGKCLAYELSYDGAQNLIKFDFSHSFEFESNINNAKITGMEFLNSELVLISTNDSIIRIVHVANGIVKQEFSGYTNKVGMIRATFDDRTNSIISCSDENKVFLWNYDFRDFLISSSSTSSKKIELTNNILSSKNKTRVKNQFVQEEYEYFSVNKSNLQKESNNLKRQYSDSSLSSSEQIGDIKSNFSLLLKGVTFTEYFGKLSLFNLDFNLNQIIINCLSNGKVQVLLNVRSRNENKKLIRKIDLYSD